MPGEILELESDLLSIAMRPDKGADIVGIVHRPSGVELMWSAPWGAHAPGARAFETTSLDHWVARNGGGWNLLLPNAGPPRAGDGVELGFHGEAALVTWSVRERSRTSARLSTSLMTAPLDVVREVRVVGATLEIEETVTNNSPEPVEFRWGHHPTFGEPLIEPGARIEIDAGTAVVESATGVPLPARTRGQWPEVGDVDLSEIVEDSAVLAYLTDLREGRAAIVNERLGLTVELRWPLEVLPWMWVWVELGHTRGYPWFRRVRALALEPHSNMPDATPGIVLGGGDSTTVALTMSVSATAQP
jgi:galactose mutarotase-like enzyme